MESITREHPLALLQSHVVQLVEALPADAFAAEHIPEARNLPSQATAEQAGKVAPDPAVPGATGVAAAAGRSA